MNIDATGDPVVTVTPTVMDGTVVRWHHSVRDAEIHRPVVSASRRGVAIHAEYITDVPVGWIVAATQAYEALLNDRRADLGHLATHRNQGHPSGPLVPVTEVSTDG
ncbi:hypothetical protein [Streptosporangium sp. NPDC002607]